tara:strand:- start:247 stop:714 length:468 start_codon:yes stop_codon:yes gene_type:complete
MAFKINKLKTTSQGVWVDCGQGLKLKVARLGNPTYEEELRKLGKPYMRQMRLGTMNVEDIENLAKKAISKHIIQGWENLEDDDGPIEFSPEKALELFNEYPDFYTLVKDVSNEAELFRTDEMEEAAGNSEATCDSNLNGGSTKSTSSNSKKQESK